LLGAAGMRLKARIATRKIKDRRLQDKVNGICSRRFFIGVYELPDWTAAAVLRFQQLTHIEVSVRAFCTTVASRLRSRVQFRVP
jgi:hypothetical protein